MEERHPLAVGNTAPDFELPTSRGNYRRLSDLLAGGFCLLVFYRGHW
jgi:peroxiredoxin